MLTLHTARFGGLAAWVMGLALGAVFFASPLPADQSDAISDAVDAANDWLSIVDEGKYPKSYEEFSRRTKFTLSLSEWVEQCMRTRAPLGELISRNLQSKRLQTRLPSGRSGLCVILQYQSKFKNGMSTEMVAVGMDPDREWRIASYSVR